MSNSVYPVLAGSQMEIDREPIYGTIVQREAGGRELRVNTQTAARYRYRIRYDFLRQDSGGDEAATLQTFFSTHRGSWDSFFFTDPYNSALTARNFGTGDGITVIFHLKDEMGDRVGGTTGTVLIYVDAVLQTVTTHYTLDVNAGTVTFVTAPAEELPLTWTGSFYRRVRFADDGLQLQRRFSRVWRGDVTLVSVLP